MRRSRICSALLAVAAAGALAAGCGGGEDREPLAILESALSEANQPRSGVVDISGDITLEGDQSGNFTVKLSGPFQANDKGALDAAQLDVEVGGELPGLGGGLTLNGGVAVADEKLFVTWQNQTYELDEGSAREIAPGAPAFEADEITQEDRDQLLNALGNLENEGSEEIDGVETTHISAEIDVEEALEDQEIDTKEIDVEPVSLDFYVGTDDDVLRRVDVSLTARPGEGVPAEGVDSVAASFTVTFSEVNEEQTIDVPRKAKPFSELFENLGLGSLGMLGISGDIIQPDSGGEDAGKAVAEAEKAAKEAAAKGAELAECLKDAAGDPEALQKCTE